MLRKFEFYNSEKTYLFPNLELATPERIQMEFSAVNNFKCVVETDEEGQIFYASYLFTDIRDRLGVERGLSDEETLIKMAEKINTPPVINSEPTAEERIASAMEYQNLLMS